jgi:release factor glutamine methyltransferase
MKPAKGEGFWTESQGLGELLKVCSDLLREVTQSPDFESKWLLSSLLGISSSDLFFHRTKRISKEKVGLLKKQISRRLNGEPLQYILGEVEFFGFDLKVGPGVFIPRPETEGLVELVLTRLSLNYEGMGLEFGTGSGAISLALLKNRPFLKMSATEKSSKAFEFAKKNLEAQGCWERIDLFQENDLLLNDSPIQSEFDFFVSNPPYIHPSEKDQIERQVIGFEPHEALFLEGEDERKYFIWLLSAAKRKLKKKNFIALEIGEKQRELVLEVSELIFPDGKAKVLKDLSDRDRYLWIENMSL